MGVSLGKGTGVFGLERGSPGFEDTGSDLVLEGFCCETSMADIFVEDGEVV
jgi:hypothetical protein